MSIGTLTSFLFYTISTTGSLAGMSSLYGIFMSALGASERVFKLMDCVPSLSFLLMLFG